jgi:hypothetical protein
VTNHISEDVPVLDLKPGDRFTSRWTGDNPVTIREALTVVDVERRPLGGLNVTVKMPSGDTATRIFNAGTRVFRWIEDDPEQEVAAAVKGLGPDDAHGIIIAHSMNPGFETEAEALAHRARIIARYDAAIAPFLEEEKTDRILADVHSDWVQLGDETTAAYAAEAAEDSEDDGPTERELLKMLDLNLHLRDHHDDKILELRRELRAMWGDD